MRNQEQQTTRTEISLKDIVAFLRRNGWTIAPAGLAGLLFSAVFVLVTPKTFEAIAQLQVAQFVHSNSDGYTYSNSEEPAALIQRLRLNTSYPAEARQDCGISKDEEMGEYLGGRLEVLTIKGVANAVEMKVRASTPDQARKCAEGIVEMLAKQQAHLIDEHFSGRQEQLLQYQQALRDEQLQLEKIKKTELGNFGYLAKLDKLGWLRARIDALQEEAMLSRAHPAKLTTPIYLKSRPVSPKRGPMLLLGVIMGLTLGLLYALGREALGKAA